MEYQLRQSEKLLYSLRALYRSHGYRPFRMSKFESYELYAGNKDFLVSDRIITFSDSNGELLALKPDVTLSIVRSAACRTGHRDKLYYQENVYRPSGNSRQFREIMQCGLECIGDLDGYDVYEVLDLAGESLLAVSDESLLCISHLGILRCLFRALGADEASGAELQKLIAARAGHEIAALFERRGWNPELLKTVRQLLSLRCPLRELPEELRKLDTGWLDRDVLAELGNLAELSRNRARFDFSVINDLHYYSGLVFQGFVPGIAEKLLSGGQYDPLLRRMGKQGAAIGFAVYLGLLEQLWTFGEEPGTDLLLLYDDETPMLRLRDEAERLRKEGFSVDTARTGEDRRCAEIVDLRGGGGHA